MQNRQIDNIDNYQWILRELDSPTGTYMSPFEMGISPAVRDVDSRLSQWSSPYLGQSGVLLAIQWRSIVYEYNWLLDFGSRDDLPFRYGTFHTRQLVFQIDWRELWRQSYKQLNQKLEIERATTVAS